MDEKKMVKVPTAGSIFLKATLLSLTFAGAMLLITAIGVLGYGYHKLTQFTQRADTTVPELITLIKTGKKTTPQQSNGYKTILLLGVDSVSNKPDSPELTDTIVLISINMKNGSINTLALPRDLWAGEYKTKINSLYEYGKEKYPERPEQFSQEVISDLTNIEINHTITLKLETVAQIIDILGGIDVEVTQGFIDEQFPREDIDVTSAREEELYETVIFEEGLQHMDGNTTLKYIRSRKSSDLSQGTDVARSGRQQQVISALISRLLDFSIINDMDNLADLYILYNNTFEKQFSKIEVIATINHLLPKKDSLNISSHSLSIYPDDLDGVITNPPTNKYQGQWVYEIRNLEDFQLEIKKKLQQD